MIEGIRQRTFITVLLPLVLMAVILGLFFISVRVEDARSQMEIQGQRFAQYLAASSEFNLLSGNREELQEFADIQLSNSRVLSALAFVDQAGNILAQAGAEPELVLLASCYAIVDHCERREDRLFFNIAIFSHGISIGENPEFNPKASNLAREMLGRVIFTYDTRQLMTLQQDMLRDGLLIICLAILLAGIVSYFFAAEISTPIARLSSVVARIQHGDLSARTVLGGRGELLDLERGINAMAEKVEQANETLQQKVEQSTKDLLITLAQLKLKNSDLEEARSRAEQAGQVKDLFLAKMSHELRTPLASVIGYLKLLEDAEDASQRRAYGKIIDQASAILLATIDDILDFIRLEEEQICIEQEEFFLRDCLENVVALQAPEAGRKQLQLISRIDDSVPETAVGDRARLAQVITNLLSNAIKFTEHGEVCLTASSQSLQGGILRLLVNVKDTGIGIPKGRQANLFEPFIQAEESINRRYGGSGLGLAISRRLVEAMQGYISLQSDEGKGVAIEFSVLLHTSIAGPVERSEPIAEPAIGRTVLLVEDDDLNRQLVRIQLEAEGAGVMVAENANRALQLAATGREIDIVLMDVHLPGMDGIELAPELSRLLPDAAILALTANITGSEEAALMAAGVTSILYKPLNEATLRALLQDSGKEESAEVVKVEEYPEQASQLILPPGISRKDVTTEFNRLLLMLRESYAERHWDTVYELAHKLLGSAKLFTRGSFAVRVLELEKSARLKDGASLERILVQVSTELENFV